MPVMSPLFNLFGQSPFRPLQEHMRLVVRCANEVPALFEAVHARDSDKVAEVHDRIFTLENEADEIKNQLRAHLPKSMFMPVDRRDLLEILDLQDSIADAAQDIAGMMVVRELTLPDPMRRPLMGLTRRCVDACNQLAKIMEELDELVETGFRGPESDKVMEMITELSRIESDTDVRAIELMRALFMHEEQIGAVSTIMWDRVIHWVGDLANYAERAGNRHRLLIAR
ncbi:MAG: TIGR00153 family protein [Alphaproteobacteria bacterium]|nr:TIGR00153 family protein [Alphaproteobacteria bacterium]